MKSLLTTEIKNQNVMIKEKDFIRDLVSFGNYQINRISAENTPNLFCILFII